MSLPPDDAAFSASMHGQLAALDSIEAASGRLMLNVNYLYNVKVLIFLLADLA